ncbi:MAG: TOBE domain-containing protein [Opitutus sp.]|nr:TOBE domain-containing protein [Opitutus sp.]
MANFIGETDFIAGRVVSAHADRAIVATAIGEFEGVWGNPAKKAAAVDEVTLSVRPECWKLGREAAPRNSVRGRIGEAIYLGEVAQYQFATSGETLNILEMNPRFIENASDGELYASAVPEDVVVLTE